MKRVIAMLAGSAFITSLCVLLASVAAAGPMVQSVGMVLQPLPGQRAADLSAQLGFQAGVLVAQVTPNSSAAKAGVEAGDVLIFVSGRTVKRQEDAEQALSAGQQRVPIYLARPRQDGGHDLVTLFMELAAGGIKTDIQAKLDALETAHNAGVFSDDEYAAKKAQLEALLQPAQSEVDDATRRKLDALDALHSAGLLSKAEYDRKRAEILAQAQSPEPAMDETTRKRIAALDSLLQAGLLTQNEYTRKRAEILGGAGGGDAGTPPSPVAANLTPYRDPLGRYEFQRPTDWAIVPFPDNKGVTVQSGEAFISVMVAPGSGGPTQFIEAFLQSLRQGWQDLREISRTPRKVAGQDTMVVEFTGINTRGVACRAQMTAVISGTFGHVIMRSAPVDQFAAGSAIWQAALNSYKLPGAGTAAGSPPPQPAGGGGGA